MNKLLTTIAVVFLLILGTLFGREAYAGIKPIPATDDPIHTVTVTYHMNDTATFSNTNFVVTSVRVVEFSPIVIAAPIASVSFDVTVRILSDYQVAIIEGDLRGAIEALVTEFKDNKLREVDEELKSRGHNR